MSLFESYLYFKIADFLEKLGLKLFLLSEVFLSVSQSQTKLFFFSFSIQNLMWAITKVVMIYNEMGRQKCSTDFLKSIFLQSKEIIITWFHFYILIAASEISRVLYIQSECNYFWILWTSKIPWREALK